MHVQRSLEVVAISFENLIVFCNQLVCECAYYDRAKKSSTIIVNTYASETQ